MKEGLIFITITTKWLSLHRHKEVKDEVVRGLVEQ